MLEDEDAEIADAATLPALKRRPRAGCRPYPTRRLGATDSVAGKRIKTNTNERFRTSTRSESRSTRLCRLLDRALQSVDNGCINH
ncbi:hypothetical protein C7S14_7375 [Burkholderia cepacia]|nr:hypothetical protein C7S14_7375 [Burkholderia cepacia]